MKKKLLILALCMFCIVAFCSPAYAITLTNNYTDPTFGVKYTISYEKYGCTEAIDYSISMTQCSITPRKGASPTGSIEFRLMDLDSDDQFLFSCDLANSLADTDCTKKYEYTYSLKINEMSYHDFTLTREATSGHTLSNTWSMVSGSTTAHERTHTLTCAEGHSVTVSCSGETATCMDKAVCTVCGETYGDINPDNHLPGAAATCTTDQICAREGCDAVLVQALGHKFEPVKKIAATCTENGCIDYMCAREGCTETERKTLKALGHWFDLWNTNADGTHSAGCKHTDCTYIGNAECAIWEATAKVDHVETILSVCPVCGAFGEKTFEVIENARIEGENLPMGEAIVRGMEAPFEGVLYAFTAGYEYLGEIQEIKCDETDYDHVAAERRNWRIPRGTRGRSACDGGKRTHGNMDGNHPLLRKRRFDD